MAKEIDCRGLTCPQPVLNTKKALEETGAGPVRIRVDNANAVENVKRFATSQGCRTRVENDGDDFILEINRENKTADAPQKEKEYVVFITTQFLGTGDEKLGSILMKSFLNTLWDSDTKPSKILFLNSGVHLTCTGSDVLDTLKLLEDSGVEIVSCGTCLAYYELKENLGIGYAGNMYEVVDSLLTSSRIIKI